MKQLYLCIFSLSCSHFLLWADLKVPTREISYEFWVGNGPAYRIGIDITSNGQSSDIIVKTEGYPPIVVPRKEIRDFRTEQLRNVQAYWIGKASDEKFRLVINLSTEEYDQLWIFFRKGVYSHTITRFKDSEEKFSYRVKYSGRPEIDLHRNNLGINE